MHLQVVDVGLNVRFLFRDTSKASNFIIGLQPWGCKLPSLCILSHGRKNDIALGLELRLHATQGQTVPPDCCHHKTTVGGPNLVERYPWILQDLRVLHHGFQEHIALCLHLWTSETKGCPRS